MTPNDTPLSPSYLNELTPKVGMVISYILGYYADSKWQCNTGAAVQLDVQVVINPAAGVRNVVHTCKTEGHMCKTSGTHV